MVPLLAEMVGLEYLVELLRRGELRLLRSRMVPGAFQGTFVWITPSLPEKRSAGGKPVPGPTYGHHDWPKAAFAPRTPRGCRVGRQRRASLSGRAPGRGLKEAIVGATTEVERGPIWPEGLRRSRRRGVPTER